jgi:hypothetical protein
MSSANQSNDQRCDCRCPDGPCTHKFDGPEIEIKDGGMLDGAVSVTCSKCGTSAIWHDVKVGP